MPPWQPRAPFPLSPPPGADESACNLQNNLYFFLNKGMFAAGTTNDEVKDANGNGCNTNKFALRQNGGKAESEITTALGTGDIILNDDLLLCLAGAGTAALGMAVSSDTNDYYLIPINH